jgi:hypothetical protein
MKIFEQSFTISLDVARARRFRFVVKPNSPPARPMTTAPPPTKQWPHPAYLELDASGQAARYAPVGRCIYCGATEFIPGTSRALSEEHVIPEGLGAKLILPEASCKRCSNATTRFEGSVLRSLLWTARRHLKIPGKKRKREERLYPVTAIIDGNEVQFELPLPRYPVTLLLPELRRPGILSSRDSAAGGIRGIWVQKLNSFDGVSAAGIKEFAPPAIDTVRFCQLLAKTAHGFAVSQLGMDGFTLLRSTVR